jgi:hypothetical protein
MEAGAASLALVRLTSSLKLPSDRTTRYMPGHLASDTMPAGSLGFLSVTSAPEPPAG